MIWSWFHSQCRPKSIQSPKLNQNIPKYGTKSLKHIENDVINSVNNVIKSPHRKLISEGKRKQNLW